jgi:hypothetical protein
MRPLHRVAVFVWMMAIAVPFPAVAEFADGLAAFDAGDYRAAIAAWRPLAESGDSDAQVALAGLHRAGHGVPADAVEAMHWYRLAAEAGNPVAQLNLGDAYAQGIGVAADPVSAYVWLSLAAAHGRQWPERRRLEIAHTMSSAQMAEARARLDRWRAEH